MSTPVTDKIIAKLRSETAVAAEKTAEMARLQAEMKGLREAADATQAEKQKLQTSLEAAQAENKALQAKLSATRSTSEQAKTMPGSAVKGGPAARQAASAEAQKDIAKRKLKEELYGDLTDLIIRDVKRREETGEDVFDCFQTGRNGSKSIPDLCESRKCSTDAGLSTAIPPFHTESAAC